MIEQRNVENNLTVKRERNYGIDILRVISMFMVTLLHFAGHGGYKGNPESGTIFYIMSFLIVICYGAVDIFALISGYVMYGSKIKYKRIISLWFQVLFYSVGLTAVENLVIPDAHSLLGAFFPVFKAKFWYFSVYFFMFFLIPFFNNIVEDLSGRKIFSFLAVGFVIFCICSNIEKFFAQDFFGLIGGYSIMWLSFCYIFGAFIKKYEAYFYKISNKVCVITIIVCDVLTYIGNVLLFDLPKPKQFRLPPRDFLLKYTSPTVFVAAICLLIIFSRLKVNRGIKPVKILSATSFSVYIVQTHSLVWDNFLCKYSTFFDVSSVFLKTLLVLGGSVVLYIVASFADYLRIQLFKLLHIDTSSAWLCGLFDKVIRIAKNHNQCFKV